MAEMLTDLLQNIYKRIAQLGKSIQELKGSLDGLNLNIEEKISKVTEKLEEFSSEINLTQTKHIDTVIGIGENTTNELKVIQEGLGLDALNNLISKLEDFAKLSESVLNQDTVNLLLSEAINSVKNLKESLNEEEVEEVEKMAEQLLEELIKKINQIQSSLDGTIAQVDQMSTSIGQMSQKFSEQTVAMTENIRLIVEVLKQFRVQSSKSLQELSDDFNEKVKDLWDKKSIEIITEEEKKAIEIIRRASKTVSDNLYFAQLLNIIQSIREETNRIISTNQ